MDSPEVVLTAVAVQALALAHIILVVLDGVYIPRGVRTQYLEAGRGEAWRRQLLERTEEAEQRLFNATRIRRRLFQQLLIWLQVEAGLKDGKLISAEQKLLIFLMIVAQGLTFRKVAEDFQHSTRSVSLYFHQVLKGMLLLHQELVQLPPNQTPKAMSEEPKARFLIDAIGALDGTHLPIFIRDSEPRKPTFQNRKGYLSQNVLAAVDFDMNFVFVLPGWEGSANDSKVLFDAFRKGFEVPEGRYYLADGGYSCNLPQLLVPFQKTRYHLREQGLASVKPANAEELFNLRHAQFRNVIERVFGVFKRRFKWFAVARIGYSLRTQVKVVYAATALFNFMNKHGYDPEAEYEEIKELEDIAEEQDTLELEAIDRRGMVARRAEIAELMWEDYQQYR